MKITLAPTNPDVVQPPTVIVEISDDSDIYEVIEVVAGALITWGYHSNSVIDGMSSYVAERETADHTESPEE